MPIGAVAGAIIGAGITGGASVAGGIMANRSSNKASQTALDANNHAADLEAQTTREALAAAKEQQDYERWLTSATADARKPYLDAMMAAIGSAPSASFSSASFTPQTYTAPTYDAAKPFVAPTQAEVTGDAGYQFRLGEGQKALERSAASRGTLLTTGTLKDVTAYGQDMATQEYDKLYGRKMGEYQTAEQARQAAFDRNAQSGYQAASMNNENLYRSASLSQQGAYQSASLQMDAYRNQLSSLFSLAGLASPGAYPGSAGGGSLSTQPVGGPATYQPGMQAYGGDSGGLKTTYANGITPEQWNTSDPLNPTPYGMYGSA